MRVFVAGATGALGRPLVRELRSRGHTVAALSRSDENDRLLRELGAEPRQGSLFDPASVAAAAEGADVVIRAATHIPKGSERPGSPGWRENDRVRREGTRALLSAARRVGAKRYLQESIVWVARPPDGSPFDEKATPRPDSVVGSAIDAESEAEGAVGDGLTTATLRLGLLYGAQTAHTRDFAVGLRRRRLPIVGRGDAPLSFLHVEDAARAFADAAEAPSIRGVYHVVDDAPTPAGEMLSVLAREIGAPSPRRVPAWLGRLVAGEYMVRTLTTPMVTSSRRFREAAGWKPWFGSVREGLEQVVASWRAEGFV